MKHERCYKEFEDVIALPQYRARLITQKGFYKERKNRFILDRHVKLKKGRSKHEYFSENKLKNRTFGSILARHRVSSSSVVRASVLEHGRSWVRIPSGAQNFSLSFLVVDSFCNYFLFEYFLRPVIIYCHFDGFPGPVDRWIVCLHFILEFIMCRTRNSIHLP